MVGSSSGPHVEHSPVALPCTWAPAGAASASWNILPWAASPAREPGAGSWRHPARSRATASWRDSCFAFRSTLVPPEDADDEQDDSPGQDAGHGDADEPRRVGHVERQEIEQERDGAEDALED